MLNVIILLSLGADSLGIFNQIYAIFVISGQITVLGLHDSAQKHNSEFSDIPIESHLLSVAALLIAILAGLVGAVFLALLSGQIGRFFQSTDVGRGILLIAPGLFFFTINKVLMGILNGQRRMGAFAVGQSIRAVSVLLVCLIIVFRKDLPYKFGLSFTCAELLLLFSLLIFVKPVGFHIVRVGDIRKWMSRHFRFGSKAFVHGFLSEAFIRIDIIMLGIFVSDRAVGIYSFAAMFLEGAYQVSIVIRTITNPILVRLLLLCEKKSIVSFARRTALLSFSATFIVSAAIILVYPYFKLFIPEETIDSSYGVLLILLTGLLLYSTCVPFDYIFLQAGKPGIQSVYMTINTMMNAAMNLALIPFWGIYGACIATAFSFVFSSVLLNVLSSRMLGMHGGIFLHR
ncbi:MAG: oligosaccharide flippase family protein [Candidatus Brocadiaceae bacterium]|nr:oligosaccharide flippase family protein [Candidatus Brocadiaceae bacterium]